MKIQKREIKYHVTLTNGDHVDLLIKEYIDVTNLVLVIKRDDKIWTIEGHLFTESSYAIPILMDVTKGDTSDSWAIYDLLHALV